MCRSSTCGGLLPLAESDAKKKESQFAPNHPLAPLSLVVRKASYIKD